MINPLGQAVTVSTNALPPGLLPPARVGLDSQVPTPARGGLLPQAVVDRLSVARSGQEGFELLPAFQPQLMPYLASQDEFGNTSIKPGPLIPSTLLDELVQRGKFWISEVGLRYSLQQTFTWVGMTDVMQGSSTLGFYTFDFAAKWALFASPSAGTAGWITTQIEAKVGLGSAGATQDARTNLGSVTDPTGIWSSKNGFRIPELAWQQSMRDGEVVVVAGMISQNNYLDANSYANSGRSQFKNSALIDSMVVPLTGYNFGVNLQWQPTDEFYGMLGSSVGNGHAGVPPWNDFSWDNWTLVGEFGYAPKNVLGLGPGVYRVQPFVGQIGGEPAQAGFGLNFQQQLGQDAPFGWFGRFGRGGSTPFHDGATATASGSQVGTGLVMKGPLDHVGLGRGNDAAGVGFVWSHPSDSSGNPIYHQNEYVLELGYVLQLTPTTKLQPDIQVVWNAAHNPDSGAAMVFQLQLDLSW
ncbi:MAG TPA: carbohydrate porin [Verrucomicrobiota bacterium]|nr:carbohydrate porin [Verrucomicrobiota bacterium]